jgi:hypothetical protein
MDEPARTGGGERATDAPTEGLLDQAHHTLERQSDRHVWLHRVTASAGEPLRTMGPPGTTKRSLAAERVLFVAGSPYDIPGASRIGMDVWWHNRIGMPAHSAHRPIAEHRSLDRSRPLPAGLTTAAPVSPADADPGQRKLL